MAAKIVELIDVQVALGQLMLSRYHYVDTDGVADESVLVSDFIADVLPLMQPIQNGSLSHIALRHRQVYPTVELVQETAISPALNGTNPGVAGPDNATYSVKWAIGPTVIVATGASGHIRKGGKHLPGVVQTEMDEVATVSSSINTAIASWFTEVKDPGTDPWQLCVVSFEMSPSHIVNTSTTRTETKAVLSATATKYALVTGASPASVSTQNTRKILRGRTY